VDVRVLKDGASNMGEPMAIFGALLAPPMIAGSQRIDLGIAATGANDSIRPAAGDQICPAMLLIWEHGICEHGIELSRGELLDGFGALGSHRNNSLFREKDIALCC
jgi:hypothetical protein